MSVDNAEIRIVNGQAATRTSDDAWETPDGKRWWFCAGANCPGLQWKPSNSQHPSTCANVAVRRPHVEPTPRAITMMDHWAQVRAQHVQIMEFFDWMYTNGLEIEITKAGAPTIETPSDLADRYLGISRAQLDQERRRLLELLK